MPETNTLVCYSANNLSGSPTAHTVEWAAILEPITATDINLPMSGIEIAQMFLWRPLLGRLLSDCLLRTGRSARTTEFYIAS